MVDHISHRRKAVYAADVGVDAFAAKPVPTRTSLCTASQG
jgi:hypothetical protein